MKQTLSFLTQTTSSICFWFKFKDDYGRIIKRAKERWPKNGSKIGLDLLEAAWMNNWRYFARASLARRPVLRQTSRCSGFNGSCAWRSLLACLTLASLLLLSFHQYHFKHTLDLIGRFVFDYAFGWPQWAIALGLLRCGGHIARCPLSSRSTRWAISSSIVD